MQTIHHAAILILVAGSVSQAQDTPEDSPPKHQQIQILDKDTSSLPRMGTNQTPIEPTKPNTSTPHQTGITQGQDWMKVVNNSIDAVERPSALAQGSFVLSRTGRLVPAPNDRLIFVPALEQRLPGEGPVLLLPCATLERLERIWANQPVTVSGEILTYHGRNHLLISDFALGFSVSEHISEVQLNNEPEQPEKLIKPTEDPKQELDEDPDVLDLLRELDKEDSTPSGVSLNSFRSVPNAASRESSELQTAPPSLAPGLREGTLLIRKPARLNRASDGSWMAVFDNDDQTSPEGIELTILPCALLMTMENQVIRFGDSTKFVLSGRLYIHNDRGYILPTFYQRMRTSDIKPWQ
jgi:hypothetical protein